MSDSDDAERLERAVLANQGDQGARRQLHAIRRVQGWGQCDECGGSILLLTDTDPPCETCRGLGALPPEHPNIRRCLHSECSKPLHPGHLAVYCSGSCAWGNA